MNAIDITKFYDLIDEENESRRLELQSNIIDDTTRKIFENAGITRGMKVLDIGCGAGDDAMILAGIVGYEGKVVGIDNNRYMLETAKKHVREGKHTNITFVLGDAGSAELDDDFDALVGRGVLMFIPHPDKVLKKLLSHLRPGGIVAFQEVDFTIRPVAFPMLPLYQQAWDWIYATLEKSGAEMQIGFKLMEIYLKAGLPEPKMHMDAFVGGVSSPGLDWLVSTVRSFLPMTVKLGVATAEEVDVDTLKNRIIMEGISSGSLIGVGMSNTWISAWSKKPVI